jgi:hypothetical protein
VRRLVAEPREEDRKAVESKRKSLASTIIHLRQLQAAAGVRNIDHGNTHPPNDPEWNDGYGQQADAGPGLGPEHTLPIEQELIGLPSNGNVDGNHGPLELLFRKQQAKTALNRVRDLIADNSFQYSHVLRQASRQALKTRSRTAISKINMDIDFQARIYGRSRARMVTLGADVATLEHFCILTKNDVKSSTAIRDPNQPGSTKVKLSWIWQRAPGRIQTIAEVPLPEDDVYADQATLLECKLYPIFVSSTCLINFAVKRVHWLRARAQKMRWQEELVFVRHEMEWTVRYFLKKSTDWTDLVTEAHVRGRILSPGSIAYAKRKAVAFRHLARLADQSFIYTNPDHRSLFS